jgi:hypothetical protein
VKCGNGLYKNSVNFVISPNPSIVTRVKLHYSIFGSAFRPSHVKILYLWYNFELYIKYQKCDLRINCGIINYWQLNESSSPIN